jgi:ATP-dependent exoDNAse (exonuclease V) alpha subunit
MALFHMRAQVIGRSSGRSVLAAAAYRAGEALRDTRTGLLHDYRRKEHVEHREILTPRDAPDWMRDRAALWNAVETVERRKDAQLAREIHLALPREVEAGRRLAMVQDFVRREFVDRGMVADLVIHNPRAGDGGEQPHAHVMLTLRTLTTEGFGPKAREWNAAGLYEAWRERWATYTNRELVLAGSTARVDHRSLADRGVDREPEPKLGPTAARLERQARAATANDNTTPEAVTDRGQAMMAVRDRNAIRARLEVLRDQLGRAFAAAAVRLREHLADLGRRLERGRTVLRPDQVPHDVTQRERADPTPDDLLGRRDPPSYPAPPALADLLGKGRSPARQSQAREEPER